MTKALVVIDIQNEYFDGGLLPLWNAEETEQRIAEGIREAREQGDKVVLVKHVSKSNAGLFAAGSKSTDIRPMIQSAADGAPVVIKHVADAFQDTTLLSHVEG